MSAPAARLGDPIAHTMAMPGALTGLAAGALVGIAAVATVATAGAGAPLLAMAVGGAIAVTGGAGMAGQYIGESIQGPPCGAISTVSGDVLINGLGAARATLSTVKCSQHPPEILEATGAASVFVNGMPAGRVGEKTTCSAVILKGSSNVFIGGPVAQTEAMTPEVPRALSVTMQAMAIGGTIVATGGSIAAFGVAATAGGMVLGAAGGYAGAIGGRWAAARAGFGETGQRVAESLGGMIGGAAGGRVGFRGGQSLQRSIGGRPSPGPANFMSDKDGFYQSASKRPASNVDPEGQFDVVAHGTPHRIQVTRSNGQEVMVSHRTAARLIQQSPGYKPGQPIRMLSCSTGKVDHGFAQNLANKMNVPVNAPDEILWAWPNGKMRVAPPLPNVTPAYPNMKAEGGFRVFRPGKPTGL